MDPNLPSCSRDYVPIVTQDETQEDQSTQVEKRRLYTSEVVEMWNLARIIRKLSTREQGIAFAEEHGLVETGKECRVHRVPLHIDYSANTTVGMFYCAKKSCKNKTRTSRTKGTWFENVKIDLFHVYYLMYCYAHLWSHDKVILEDPMKDEKEQCLSRATISDWYSYCREAVVIYQLEQQENLGKIGGVGKIVQIDESKFGKRKYNKGRRVEGHWVLGIIEDGSEDLRLEVCPDNVRSADVLVPLIQKHVAVGTTIHTDFWKAYDCLDQYGYTHKKVNHSDPENPFVAPDGTHTQRIESQWRVVKRFFYKENYNHPEDFTNMIVEYMWRRNITKKKKDPFMELVHVIKHVYSK